MAVQLWKHKICRWWKVRSIRQCWTTWVWFSWESAAFLGNYSSLLASGESRLEKKVDHCAPRWAAGVDPTSPHFLPSYSREGLSTAEGCCQTGKVWICLYLVPHVNSLYSPLQPGLLLALEEAWKIKALNGTLWKGSMYQKVGKENGLL